MQIKIIETLHYMKTENYGKKTGIFGNADEVSENKQ